MVVAAFLQLSTPGGGRYMAFGKAHGLLKLVCSRHARGGSSRGRVGMARAGVLVLSRALATRLPNAPAVKREAEEDWGAKG
jgi:hypothetical protein